MHRQIAAGHTTAALKFTRSMADQIQTLVSCGAGWSWGMALFTLVSISLTIVVGWGVLTQGLMMIGDEPGLADLLVLSSRAISPGFDIGVNSSANRTDWLSNGPGGVWSMRYPGNQAWGAVFLTVGSAHTTPRPGIDLSSYQSLVLEMRGDSEGTIEVGIKDSTQPDDGKGVRLPLQISAEWRTYEIPLTSFAGADLRKIHVLTEWIFNGPQAKTIEVRSVRFTKSTGNPPSDGRRSRLGASYHLAS